jgi:glycosyl transferase family 25
MHIVVINLDRDFARLAHMRTQLDRLGLTFERFAALQGEALPARLRGYFSGCTSLSPGEIGCYASHLAIWRRIAEGDIAAPVLVLEDDVGLPDNLPFVLSALAGALPARWDIVRLSNPTKRMTRTVAALGGYELVRYSHVPTSTGAYLINASGARKLLASRGRRVPLDHDLRRVWAWNLGTFGIAPAPIKADVLGASSIDEITPGVRACPMRSIAIRRQRRFERIARFRQGVHDFGLGRWMVVEATNMAAAVTPRRARSALFNWARARVS